MLLAMPVALLLTQFVVLRPEEARPTTMRNQQLLGERNDIRAGDANAQDDGEEFGITERSWPIGDQAPGRTLVEGKRTDMH